MSALPASAQIDRVAGTRLGTLWALPAFGIVLPAISQTAGLGQVSRVAWLVSGALCWLAFACAAVQRSRARALIRALWNGAEQLGTGVVHDGDTFFGDTRVVQYEIRVALLVLEVTLLTAPRKQGGASIASAITLLLGWWSIPWGPLHAVRALVGNARGGSTRTVVGVAKAPVPEPVTSTLVAPCERGDEQPQRDAPALRRLDEVTRLSEDDRRSRTFGDLCLRLSGSGLGRGQRSSAGRTSPNLSSSWRARHERGSKACSTHLPADHAYP